MTFLMGCLLHDTQALLKNHTAYYIVSVIFSIIGKL